ncbi:MAG: magnesium chelatase, partial [Bacteroidetes bacterium]|nr:magnesium chelatase [Bacteroidota bacterium]
LVYEGEQEGAAIVAQKLINKSIRTTFVRYFQNPERLKRNDSNNPYRDITNWFGRGHVVDLIGDLNEKEYRKALDNVPGLAKLVKKHFPKAKDNRKYFLMEFVLHGLAEYSLLSKNSVESGAQFKDLLSSMLNIPDDEDDGDYCGYYEN